MFRLMKDSHKRYFQKKGDKNNNHHFFDKKPVSKPLTLWKQPQIENIKIIFNNHNIQLFTHKHDQTDSYTNWTQQMWARFERLA